jgi:D-tyrosyl-tRNA(Tyr) deacylase
MQRTATMEMNRTKYFISFFIKIVSLQTGSECYMRALIQRVSQAKVIINHETERSIGEGLVVFLGIEDADVDEDIQWLAKKILGLRIFDDENGVMNRSIEEIKGSILCISQFTLHASTRKGNRPSYIRAAKPSIAFPLYEKFLNTLKNATQLMVQSGEFGAHMQVHIVNEGPVTIWIDTKNKE